MAFKRVATPQEQTPTQSDQSKTKTRFKRIQRAEPSLSTFTREGYQTPSDQDPFYDTAKQVGYEGLRGAAGALGDIVNLITTGATKGLEYLGVPKEILDLTNQAYSYIAPKTSADIDEQARQVGINPEAKTTAGKITGNVANVASSAAILGSTPRSIKALAAGEALGDLATESGLPEPIGTGIKVASSLLGTKSPKLIGTKKQKPIIDFLRKNGFTDEQITPLLQDPKKVQIISKFAFKGGKPAKISRELQQALGDIYDTIRTEGDKLGILTSTEKTNLTNELYDIRNKIPLKWQRLINPIIDKFENSMGKASDLVQLYQDIGAEVTGQDGGKAILGLFKEPAANGLGLISPELASDFTLTNQLYGLNKKFGKAFKPTLLNNLSPLSIGQAIKFVRGLGNLNFKSLAADLGIVAARKFSTELLTNPRLQNITKRIISNANANKSNLVITGVKNLIKEIRKTDPETADAIEKSIQSTSASK